MPNDLVIAWSWSWADNPLALVSYIAVILVPIVGGVSWIWARINLRKLVARVEAIRCPPSPNYVLALKTLKDLTSPAVKAKLVEILRARSAPQDKQLSFESSYESAFQDLKASNAIAEITSCLEDQIPNEVKGLLPPNREWHDVVARVTVTSRSHTVCHDVKVKIDGAGLILVNREGRAQAILRENELVNLGDIQYGETIDVVAWTDGGLLPSDWVKVTSNEGPAKIRVVTSPLTNALKRPIFFGFLSLILLPVLAILVILLAWIVQTALHWPH